MKTQPVTLAMAEGIYVFYCFQNINVVDCYSVNFSKITANTTQHIPPWNSWEGGEGAPFYWSSIDQSEPVAHAQ